MAYSKGDVDIQIKRFVARGLGWVVLFTMYFLTVKQSDTFMWIACATVFYVLVYFIARWSGLGGFRGLGLSMRRRWAMSLLIGFAIGATLQLAEWLAMWLCGGSKIAHVSAGSSVIVSGIMTLVSTAFVGFGEEILFRGYLFATLPKRRSIVVFVALSSVMFTVAHVVTKSYHAELATIIYLTIYGIASALAYAKTRSLWFVAGVHSAFDFVSFWINYGDVPSNSSLIFAQNTKFGDHISGILDIATVTALLVVMFVAVGRLSRVHPTKEDAHGISA